MNSRNSSASSGRVASLHLHPPQPGVPLIAVDSIEVVVGKGVLGDSRYFSRVSSGTGQPSQRQVSLMEREQIAAHAAALGRPSIAPGAVRANIETLGVDLIALVGHEIQIGEAVLFLYEPRKPCAKMDVVCQGLRELMMDNRQGVVAQVVRAGLIRAGDPIAASTVR
jgi:MOSC domain-containing protein YiiM